jgi:hypothetical protein
LNDAYQKEPSLSMAFGTDQSPGLQDVENRCLVKASLVRARAPTGALGNTENDAGAGPIELVAQDSVPPSRRSLAGKRIEGEGRAVNIEPFVLQKHPRAGFHVFLSVRLENLWELPSVTSPMRPALRTRCANPTFLSRATFPWPWPCVRVRSDAAQ